MSKTSRSEPTHNKLSPTEYQRFENDNKQHKYNCHNQKHYAHDEAALLLIFLGFQQLLDTFIDFHCHLQHDQEIKTTSGS
jgi:hypothetical protein